MYPRSIERGELETKGFGFGKTFTLTRRFTVDVSPKRVVEGCEKFRQVKLSRWLQKGNNLHTC